jgi:hypothetical protein
MLAIASSSSDREDLGAVEGELGAAGHLVMDSPYSARCPSQPRENGDANDACGRPSPSLVVDVRVGVIGTVPLRSGRGHRWRPRDRRGSHPSVGIRRPMASLISAVPVSQHY